MLSHRSLMRWICWPRSRAAYPPEPAIGVHHAHVLSVLRFVARRAGERVASSRRPGQDRCRRLGFLAIRPPGGVASSVTCHPHAPSSRLARRMACQETALVLFRTRLARVRRTRFVGRPETFSTSSSSQAVRRGPGLAPRARGRTRHHQWPAPRVRRPARRS